jgi:hypothetical protein
MTIYDHVRRGIDLPEDILSFRVEETGSNRITLAYPSDVPIPKYAEGMIRAIREEFGEYREMIEDRTI